MATGAGNATCPLIIQLRIGRALFPDVALNDRATSQDSMQFTSPTDFLRS